MLDEKDLQAIREMIQEASKQTVKDAMQGASVLMESYFEPKFNLLFENQQTMLETLTPKSKTEELEEELNFLKAVVRSQSQRIEALEKRLA